MRTLEEKLALPIVRLDFGSGSHNIKLPADEWIHLDGCAGENVDIVADFSDIPLPDKCVDEAWSGDTVEHCKSWEIGSILKEWGRVIKPGGTFSGQTPNSHRIMIDYAAGKLSYEDAINGLYGWHTDQWQQHYITYSVQTLTKLLEENGFCDVTFPDTPGTNQNNIEMSWWLCWSCKRA